MTLNVNQSYLITMMLDQANGIHSLWVDSDGSDEGSPDCTTTIVASAGNDGFFLRQGDNWDNGDSSWTVDDLITATTFAEVTGGGTPVVSTNVKFTASAAAVDENAGTYQVTVVKTLAEGNISGEIALGGTATEGGAADYTIGTTNFTMNGTTTSAVFTVTINDDGDTEPAETIVLALANVVGGTLSTPNAFTLTINASDVPALPEPAVWINEVNYDDPGTDSNEFIEVAGPAGTDLSVYTLYPYKGAGGVVYSPVTALSGTIDDEGCGYGAVAFALAGIQNGPDGIALANTSGGVTTLVQFLSYEGSFAATDGPAAAYTSENIGTQTGAGPTLQLGGDATNYSAFVWETNTMSQGSLNINQTITGCVAVPQTNVSFTASGASVAESVGTYDVTITKSLDQGTVTGTIELGGTASEGGAADYTVSSTNFTLDGATTSATITITVNNDAIQEDAETVILTLANLAGGTVVAPSVFTLTISPNDPLPEGILAFRFLEDPYLQVSTKDDNLTVSNMALSVGTIDAAIFTGTYFPNEPYIEETGGWTAEDQATAKNFNFSFQPAAGYQVAVTAISFRAYATAGGPSAFGFDVRDGTATYAVDAPDSTLVEVMQPVAGINGETASINVMIQGWTNGTRATTGTGTFRLDDVVIWGSVTPTGAVSVEPTFTGVTLSSGQMVFVFSNEVAATYTLQRSVDLTAEPAFTNYTTGISGGSYTQNVVNDGPMSAYRMLKE